MTKYLLVIMAVILLAACRTSSLTSDPDEPVSATSGGQVDFVAADNPFAPQAIDQKWQTGNVFITSASLQVAESYPPQISLALEGSLPTPCHQLRVVVNPPDEQGAVNVEVYSVSDPEMMCAQVLEEFSESVPLGTFAPGHYSVYVNGELAGDFDV